jgi:hypothetical protein
VTATYAAPRRGSRVSPRRRRHQAAGHATTGGPLTGRAAVPDDRTPYWVFVRDPQRGLMISDGMNYIGRHLAEREAVKLARHYGQPAEVRPSPRA